MNDKQNQSMRLKLEAAKAFQAEQIAACELRVERVRQDLFAAEARLKEWQQAIPAEVMKYKLEHERAKEEAREEDEIIEKMEANHRAALLKAFRTGKALLPASSGKRSSFINYGSVSVMFIAYFATLAWSIEGFWQFIACMSGFGAGFLIGGYFFEANFIIDESLELNLSTGRPKYEVTIKKRYHD